MLEWRLRQLRAFLPMLVTLQALLAVGIVYGLAFLLPDVDAASALYLCTGAPTLTLLVLGLTVVPQEVARNRASGGFDYVRALPVPRFGALAAEITLWLVVQLPGTVLALVIAAARFHFALQVSPAVVPVVLVVGLTSAAIGYGLAQSLPLPVVQPLTSALSIGLLLFSPINFPLSRLPDPLRVVHEVLPITYMADLMRWSLTGVHDQSLVLGATVVAGWAAAALLLCHRMAVARG